MNQLTTDVFGNYVIQKFFEHLDGFQVELTDECILSQRAHHPSTGQILSSRWNYFTFS